MLSVLALFRNYLLNLYDGFVTSKSYQVAYLFDVHDEKLFSAMCKWSNHCCHHLLPSERDTGQ